MNFEVSVKSTILDTCIRASMNLGGVTSQELIIVKDEKSDWATNSHSILARCRNHFSQLLNVHGVNDHRQTEIHTAELLESESIALEVEMAVKS
jgi:hypothetical protein